MPSPSQSSGPLSRDADVELVERALRDEGNARQEILERMQCIPRILAAKNKLHGGPLPEAEIEDLAQDVWLAVWRKLERFRGPSLEAWVYRFCVLDFLKRLRDVGRRQARRVESGGEVEEQVGRAAAVPLEFEDVHAGLAALAEDEAEAVERKHFDGLTFEEIGEQLGVPANTAKSRYYRGIGKLRGLLRERRAEGPERRQA